MHGRRGGGGGGHDLVLFPSIQDISNRLWSVPVASDDLVGVLPNAIRRAYIPLTNPFPTSSKTPAARLKHFAARRARAGWRSCKTSTATPHYPAFLTSLHGSMAWRARRKTCCMKMALGWDRGWAGMLGWTCTLPTYHATLALPPVSLSVSLQHHSILLSVLPSFYTSPPFLFLPPHPYHRLLPHHFTCLILPSGLVLAGRWDRCLLLWLILPSGVSDR